jgi:hypothetical protein
MFQVRLRRATKGQIGGASTSGNQQKNIFADGNPSSPSIRTQAFAPREIEAG